MLRSLTLNVVCSLFCPLDGELMMGENVQGEGAQSKRGERKQFQRLFVLQVEDSPSSTAIVPLWPLIYLQEIEETA